MSIEKLEQLAKTLNTSVDALLYATPQPTTAVPAIRIVSWAHAGEAADYEDLTASIDETVNIGCDDKDAFALIIEGDSMEPRFFEGDQVIISPNRSPHNGDFVVARFNENTNDNNAHGVVFKQFFHANGAHNVIELKSLNNAYSPISAHISHFSFIYPAIRLVRYL